MPARSCGSSSRACTCDARVAESVHALTVRSALAVPVRDVEGVAVLYLDDRMRPAAFAQSDVTLLSGLARVAEAGLGVAAQHERQRARM